LTATASGSTAVALSGSNTRTNGANYGVFGTAASKGAGSGVYGSETGTSNTGYAVVAANSSATGWGVYSSGTSPNYFAGNVGIGTAAPAGVLDVEGGSAAGNVTPTNIKIVGQSAVNGGASAYGANGGNILLVPGAAAGAYSSGMIGIGTTSPTAFFDVEGGTAAGNLTPQNIKIVGQSATDGGCCAYGAPGGNILLVPGTAVGSYSSGAVVIGTYTSGPANGLTVSGSVGIGTTSPAAKLDVAGAIKLSDTAQNCSHATDTGAVRFNSSTKALQFCVNGLGWQVVGGMVPLGTLTASASASLQFTNLPTSYNTLFLNCAGLLLSSSSNKFYFRVGEGATPTWETAANYTVAKNYAGGGGGESDVTNATDLTAPGGNYSSTVPTSLKMYIDNVGSSGIVKQTTWAINQVAAGSFYNTIGGGYWNADTNPITAIEVVPSAGTISSGTCSLYGMN
jgi:hypothetical protein